MSFSLYLENMELNKNDPDFQIEDFWYGFKKSMLNFYKIRNLKSNKVTEWSNKLNTYKKDKKYDLIEVTIKDCITIYAIDIMQNDEFNSYKYSNILMNNMRRWEKISNKFHFGNSQNNKMIHILFGAFNCIKLKMDKKFFPILELFRELENMFLDNFSYLIYLSLNLGQIKMLETIEKIITREKVFINIKKDFPELVIADNNSKISYFKLYRYYLKINNLN